MIMSTKDTVYLYIHKNGPVSGQKVAEHLGISRQGANKHIKSLLQEGRIVKEGITRKSRYTTREHGDSLTAPRVFRKACPLSEIEEHVVFRNASAALDLERSMSGAAYAVMRHAFTEILNNAIDHSHSEQCLVRLELNQYDCLFTIRDYGIGVFQSIREKFLLDDELAALGQLLKGKTTTFEERHSGEGIFFTSKSGDRMSFRSHRIKLSFDNVKGSTAVEETRTLRGTEVSFSLSRRSRRDLAAIFAAYSPEEYDYRFEKTRVRARFSNREHTSRSEAKRLLFGLDKFSEVVLDFQKVKIIGQAFADEIFRVFQKEHPGIIIRIENASPVIRQMISHVQVDN